MGARVIATDHVYPQLNGKKIVIYGGSFSDETSTSVSSMQPNWVTRMRWMLKDSTIINRAEAGTSIACVRPAHPEEHPKLMKQITNKILDETVTDADIIILFGGTNDYRLRKELGDYNTASQQYTFCGALYRIANKLPEIGPHAKVYVITLPKTSYSKPEWEAGTTYYMYDVVTDVTTVGGVTKERYYRCIYNNDDGHVASSENEPPNSTYWEQIAPQLRPPIVYREALATWAMVNGYTLIDGYNFPLFNPFNDPYDYVQSDGLHYEKSYAQIMADYIMGRMVNGGDTALGFCTTKVDISDLAEDGVTVGSTHYAYYHSNGMITLVFAGKFDATSGSNKTLLTLPWHMCPDSSLTTTVLMWLQIGTTVYGDSYVTISPSSGTVQTKKMPATGANALFRFTVTYPSKFCGLNNNPA